MRTSHYSAFLSRVSGLCGIDSSTLTDAEKAIYNGFFQKNIRHVWEYSYWLDNCLIEQRTPDSNLLVAFEQVGQTAIGEVFNVFDNSPYAANRPGRVGYTLRSTGIQLVGPTVADPVWVYFRKQLPTYTGSDYSASTAYSSGTTVYFTSSSGYGDYYTTTASTTAGQSPDSTPSKWSVQSIPYTFFEYVVHASYADWLRADGQNDKASLEDRNAESILMNETDKLEMQQMHLAPWIVRTHQTSRP